ncbi:MAG: hypothetical protein ABEN55_00350 [Bradymonadaceae bacterium]
MTERTDRYYECDNCGDRISYGLRVDGTELIIEGATDADTELGQQVRKVQKVLGDGVERDLCIECLPAPIADALRCGLAGGGLTFSDPWTYRELEWFVSKMNGKLADKDDEYGKAWKGVTLNRLLDLFDEHVGDLYESIRGEVSPDDVVDDAVDVANIAMMIADLGSLCEEGQLPSETADADEIDETAAVVDGLSKQINKTPEDVDAKREGDSIVVQPSDDDDTDYRDGSMVVQETESDEPNQRAYRPGPASLHLPAQTLADLLALVDVEADAEKIAHLDEEERLDIHRWTAAKHLRAAGNDVDVPPRPDVVDDVATDDSD